VEDSCADSDFDVCQQLAVALGRAIATSEDVYRQTYHDEKD
jgi:hypothetical protein